MKSIVKKTYLKKLIISYCTILILPLLVMSFSIYHQFDGVLKQELITNNANALDRTAYVLDSNFNSLHTIQDKIATGPILTSSKNLSDPEKIISMQHALSNYIASSSFINEICVYFHGEDYIYTSKSSYTLPFFINNSFIFSDWNQASFIKDINHISEAYIRPAETVQLPSGTSTKLITFLYPAVTENKIAKATLVFFVEQSYIEKLIQSNTKGSTSDIIILNKKNDLIVSTYKHYEANMESFHNFLNSAKTTDTINLSGIDFQISSSVSKSTNLKYIMLTPLSHVLKKEQTILITSFIILLLLLSLGVLVIVFSLKVTYNPIKTLKEFSSSVANINSSSGDEITSIKDTISHLTNENTNFIKKSIPMAQDYILEGLIKGRYTSAEELNEQGRPFNMVFQTHLYAVLILHIHEGTANKTTIRTIMNNFFFGFIKEDLQNSERFVAVITPDNSNPELLSDATTNFQQLLKEELDVIATIGVGNIYDEIQKIPVSYMQACSAIDYRLIKGKGSIIRYSAISSLIEDVEISYPNRNLETLKYFIQQGDTENVYKILNDTLDFIKKDNIPLFIVRNLCFDMINTIWKSFNEIKKTLVFTTNQYPNITVLSKYDTVDDLIQILKNFCANICNEINDSTKKDDELLINSILNFIKENYHDSNFTVQIMADHFDMSLTNISQYFKAHTGQTIIDYIATLRITKAKDMLLNTEMSVNEIAQSVGYLSSSSFIRRFKQITGLTPVQYLKENKK